MLSMRVRLQPVLSKSLDPPTLSTVICTQSVTQISLEVLTHRIESRPLMSRK